MKFTLEELQLRHSVRAYSGKPVDDDIKSHLKAEITMTNTQEAGMNFQIFFDDATPLQGFRNSYGFFKGVSNYLACVVDNSFPDVYVKAGYYAEKFVMEAQRLGISTCFIGGTYNKNEVKARIRASQQLLFIVAFGYKSDEKPGFVARLAKKIIKRGNKDYRQFYDGDDKLYNCCREKFPWLEDALQAVACAPSSLNKRPCRLYNDSCNGNIRARVDDSNKKNLIDLGIAKFNVEQVAPDGYWEWGNSGAYILDED